MKKNKTTKLGQITLFANNEYKNENTDFFKNYENEIKKYKEFNEKEIKEMLKNKNKQELVKGLLLFVYKYTMKFISRYSISTENKKDIIQNANMAILKAIEKYDIKKNGNFKKHLKLRINYYTINFLYKSDKIVDKPLYLYITKKNEIENENDEENFYLKKIRKMNLKTYIAYKNLGNDMSLDEYVYNNNNKTTKADIFLTKEDDILENTEKKFLWNKIKEAINTMDEKSKKMLYMRYFENKTYDEISKNFDMSATRVNQLLDRTINKLASNPELKKLFN